MATSVAMPPLGENVTEGTVTRWLKREGESVRFDEPLLEVATDKVDTEIPSPVAGVIRSILVAEQTVVAVGETLAVIDASTGDEAAPAAAPAAASPTATPLVEPAAARPQAAPDPPAPPAGSAALVTPLVRKTAAEHGIDLATVAGTGAGGRIRQQDVVAAAAGTAGSSGPAAPATAAPATAAPATPVAESRTTNGRTEPLSRLRKVIASRMVTSLQSSAQLTSVLEADLTTIAGLRDRAKNGFLHAEGLRLSFLPFVAVAAVDALAAHPMVNASVDTQAGTATYFDHVDLAVAVDTDRGLLAPVIHGADQLNLTGIARRIAALAQKARNNALSADELQGGTFTITNTGSRGALFDTPVLNQPQVGILGVGAVVRRPAIVTAADGTEAWTARAMAYLSLTYDHRLVDGADAARFLSTVKARLEGGEFTAELARYL